MNLLNSKNRREYLLYHLFRHLKPTKEIMARMVFIGANEPVTSNKILFRISEKRFDISSVITIDGVPFLFPIGDQKSLYSIENNSLVFHQDVLTSAFYLLSGQQEHENKTRDSMGRFPYAESVQCKLDFISIPIVNYYFQMIIEAIEKYCHVCSISFQQMEKKDHFQFCLTHDIDRIEAYSTGEVVHRFLRLIGLAPHSYPSRTIALKAFIKQFAGWLHINPEPDPYWSFQKMREIEKKIGFISTWYFIEKTKIKKDSKYHFSDKKIKEVIHSLIKDHCEIGLHGSLESTHDLTAIKASKKRLEDASGTTVKGFRQHFLVYDNLDAALYQDAGFEYDSTLGFAEHEGFRNSYCFPFRIYDFNSESMLNIWEYPLIAMDTTLLHYRKLSFTEMEQSILHLIDEIKKFEGIFVLLWHNSNFDEYEFPGITKFYTRLLSIIKTTL